MLKSDMEASMHEQHHDHGTHDGPVQESEGAAASGEQALEHGRPSEGGRSASSWRGAAQATLHCLTGCAIGEVLGMVISTAVGLPNAASIALSIALAFVFGYALTSRGVLRSGATLRVALGVAFAADTVSIAVMELVDNGFVLAVPGAMDATLTDSIFWVSLIVALVLAFAVATPVNRWLIARGRGHAVVHRYHH
jgi:putative flippase GtrA